jgi:cell division protein FtsB
MDYIGLTEDEMLDVLINAAGEMERDKEALRKRLRTLALRDEEIEKRMENFESTYVIRKLIAENNRRIAVVLDDLDLTKKNLFI